MHLIQILLPLYDNQGNRFGPEPYREIRDELSGRFGGLTAFSRAPAEGEWREGGKSHRDDIVVYEVMTESLDEAWWREYRAKLEQLFRQDEIIVRAQTMRLL
jgi:hypothetical protein